MPISRYIETSNLARPGVCTSTTRPASPYEGMVIYETNTDRTLVWNASAWVAPNSTTANPPGLELVKTQTIGTGVSSIVVNDAFSSTYDDYLVTVSGGAGTVSDAVFTLRLGSETTGYYYSLIYSPYSSSVLGAGSTVQSLFVYVGGSHSDGLRANITIQSPFLSKPTGVIAHVQNRLAWSGNMTGYMNNSFSFTQFTLGVSSGTVTGGTIRVYGYRN